MAEPTSAEHEWLLSDYVDLWNGDRSKLDVVSESVVVSDPGAPGEVVGRDAFETHLDELRTGFPDFRVAIDDTLASGEVVMTEWRATGTHRGEFNGLPPTDREMEVAGMDKILIEDGKIQEHRIYYDVRGMLEQLGLAGD